MIPGWQDEIDAAQEFRRAAKYWARNIGASPTGRITRISTCARNAATAHARSANCMCRVAASSDARAAASRPSCGVPGGFPLK